MATIKKSVAKKSLTKAQSGKVVGEEYKRSTPFQDYLKNNKGAVPSDTVGKSVPGKPNMGYYSSANPKNEKALSKAIDKTYSKKKMGGATIKKSLVKKQDGGDSDSDRGILTPDGRLKSRRERSVTADRSESKASVTRTKLNGDKVTKNYNTSYGFVPSSSYTKTVTGKDGTVKSESKTPIDVNKAERKTNRIINNVGRNKNDSWSMKKGGVVKKTVVKKKK